MNNPACNLLELAGEWLVDDPTAPQNGHKHAPSCILARFRAHINIPIRDESGNVTNKTIVIPPLADVIGDCGETVQTLTLNWNNTWDSGKLVRAGTLSLLFTRVVRFNEQVLLFYSISRYTLPTIQPPCTCRSPKRLSI